MQPLADSLRPQNLDEFIGQPHLVGDGKPLRQAIERGHIMNFILWGPPGTGKTTIARIYAAALDADLHELSAVDAGKSDLRDVVLAAAESDRQTFLFLDEIHRFNKAQQDFLLPYEIDHADKLQQLITAINYFEKDTDNKLSTLTNILPTNIIPKITPLTSSASSVLGIGLTSETKNEIELRSFADNVVIPHLMSVEGVADVNRFGGKVRQYQIKKIILIKKI